MNNIYKVIWSKAKNCYVVASEIARSHTKSASGSEKIGGVTRRSLLASLMALSLLCGGLGVASATLEVVNQKGTDGTVTIYTQDEVDKALEAKGAADDVATNKAAIIDLKKAVGDAGSGLTKDVSDQKADIATNKANIAKNKEDITKLENDKLRIDVASATYATKDALDGLTTVVNGKADAADVDNKLANKADAAALAGKADKTYVDQKLTEAGNNVEAKLASYATTAYVDGKITAEANARETAITTAIGQERNDRDTAIVTAINGEVANRDQAIHVAIQQEVTARDVAIANAKTQLQEKVNAEEIKRKEEDTKLEGKITENTNAINNEKTAREAAVTDLSKRIGTVDEDGKYIKKSTTNNVSENLKVLDKQAKTNADKIQTNADNIKNNKDEIARVNGELVKTNDYFNTELGKTNDYFNKELSKTNNHFNTELGKTNAALQATNKRTAGIGRTDTGVEADNQTVIEGTVHFDQKGNMSGVKDLQTDTIHANGEITSNGLNAGDGEIKTNGKVSAGNVSTGTLETTGDATIGRDLTVKGILNTKDVTAETIHVSKSEDTPDYTSKGSIIGEGGHLSVSNEKTDKRTNITEKSELNVNEKGTVNWATSTDATGNVTGGRSEVAADHIKNSVQKTEGGKTFGYDENITAGGKGGTVTDKAGNTTYTKVTATENSFQVQDKDGNKNHQVNTKDSSKTEITNADGKTTTTEQTATDITNTAKDGTITNDAQNIVNTATTMKTTVTGKATESYGELETTVTGQATEKFKGGLDTTVTGAENHTVTGKQTNTVGGGQINNITGGQKNNILTGNQETTVSDGSIINKADNGDISNTAKNVTNVGTESVTNKVGANEVKVSSTDGVDITAEAGKKITESVGTASRVVENDKITDKAGDMTVTTDKTTGTTFGNGTPYDTTVINGGTIGTNKVNANETNTKKLTAGADDGADGGRLTVDADGVKGSYKSGDYTSRSYILPDTLKSGVDNGKEPTEDGFVGSRTDHYMDGDNAKLDETVKDAAGSNVTNKTSTDTVTTITDGTTTTKTEQTEKMVQSYVGKKDGSATNVTTNFANASANQVTENGQTSTVLNNKDGLLIRNNANGNSFTTADGTNTVPAREWTNIKGNEISTGKVEANYAKMGYADVMKDLGVHGNATVKKNLTVEGTTNLKNTNVDGTLDVTGDAAIHGNQTIDGTLKVTKEATFEDSVSIAKDLSVTGDVTAKSYKVGDKTYISADGINANNQKITNVADGSISEGSKDAVNGGQLYGMKTDLEHKVDKVGANAAAMANLHPMEFDPDSKWNIAAAMGNYGSETATAIGAFYRPNEDVMVNFSTAFGTGENMVGGGVSVRLGKGSNKLSREESNALKDQVNDLTARMDALLSVLNPNMSKDFPDVPENHWAYEAVSRLAGNDIVQGYPDGEFHGERTMTRYEMAEIIYNALSRGAEAERELVEEFKPELQAMAASEKATAERAEG